MATDTTGAGTVFETRTFEEPDERITFSHGHWDVVHIRGRRLVRVTYEPGFRWSVDMAPVAKTQLCQLRHVFWVISGRMNLRLSDGTETIVARGDLASVAPDHDSWVIGDEPIVLFDIEPRPDPVNG
jgi:ribosomal protein S4E